MTVAATALRNPYVGPRAFEPDETLYGREREALDLLDLLIAERIVLLYSPSGAGKTSLIKADLMMRLQKEGFQVRPVARVSLEPPAEVTRNGHEINRYVLSAMLTLESTLSPEQQTPVADLATMTLLDFLNHARDKPENDVLILDQFEEILTVDPTDQGAKVVFFTQLGAALRERGRWALFAMREDYVAGLDPYLRLIPTRLGTTFRLDFLGEAQARQAIQQPARRLAVDFADNTALRLIDDLRKMRVQRIDGTTEERLGPWVEPVQLQVVCQRLWERRKDPSQIALADVDEIGNVDDALADYYAEQVARVAREQHVSERAIREWCEKRLITDQGIRGQVIQGPGQSEGLDNKAIQALVDAYLVRAEERRGATWYELAHDRLIVPIRANNADWREANLSPLQRRAALWDGENRPDGLLLQHDDLREAREWARIHDRELMPAERDLLKQSQAADERARRDRVLNWIVRLVSVALLLAVAVAVYEDQVAGQARSDAQVRELAADALTQLVNDPELSVSLAMEAVQRANTAQDTQRAADALRQSLLTSRLRATLRHSKRVNYAAFSPDGTRIVTASADGTAQVWDAASGKHLFTLKHPKAVSGALFSPDGRLIVTACRDGVVRVWDAASRRLLHALHGHTQRVNSVAVSPDSRLIASASDDGTARVWDAASGHLRLILSHRSLHGMRPPDTRVFSVAFSPNSKLIVTASADRTARVWSATTGKELQILQGHRGIIHNVAFSPDGTLVVTASRDGTARVWDIRTRAQSPRPPCIIKEFVPQFMNTDPDARSAAFSSDSSLVITGNRNQEALVWNVRSCHFVARLRGHLSTVVSAVFSRDGKLALTASLDHTARLWDTATWTTVAILSGHTSDLVGALFSPDLHGQRAATISLDWTARIWDTRTALDPVHTLKGPASRLTSAAFSPDGARIVTASADGTAQVWDAASGKHLFTLKHPKAVSGALFSPNGRLIVTACRDGVVRVWDAASRRLLHALHGHTQRVNSVAVSPDSRLIASASDDGTARVWDAASGRIVATLGEHGRRVTAAVFSPDSVEVATASADGAAELWRARTGKRLYTLTGHHGAITDLAFSPDGRLIVTAGDDGIARLWDVRSGMPLPQLIGHLKAVRSAAFSPDGKLVVTASDDGTARLWNVRTGAQVAELRGHRAPLTGAVFSPNGAFVVTASRKPDSTARVWQVHEAVDTFVTQAYILRGSGEDLSGAVFDPKHGMSIVTAGDDGMARLYRCEVCGSVADLMHLAQRRGTRQLTSEERKYYLQAS